MLSAMLRMHILAGFYSRTTISLTHEAGAGPRTAKAIADAVLAQLPDTFITAVRGAASLEAFKATNELPKAILASAKTKTTPLYKSLSLRFKGRLAFAAVRTAGLLPLMCKAAGAAAGNVSLPRVPDIGYPKRRSRTQTRRLWRRWACQPSRRWLSSQLMGSSFPMKVHLGMHLLSLILGNACVKHRPAQA